MRRGLEGVTPCPCDPGQGWQQLWDLNISMSAYWTLPNPTEMLAAEPIKTPTPAPESWLPCFPLLPAPHLELQLKMALGPATHTANLHAVPGSPPLPTACTSWLLSAPLSTACTYWLLTSLPSTISPAPAFLTIGGVNYWMKNFCFPLLVTVFQIKTIS